MVSDGKKIVDFGVARKNLRQKAKQEARTEKDKKAQENRVRFGRSGSQKKKQKLDSSRREKLHEDHHHDSADKPNNMAADMATSKDDDE